jgi:hypothetical protein
LDANRSRISWASTSPAGGSADVRAVVAAGTTPSVVVVVSGALSGPAPFMAMRAESQWWSDTIVPSQPCSRRAPWWCGKKMKSTPWLCHP